jgi:hypothetical protein
MPANNTYLMRRGTSTEWATAQAATAVSITAISYAAGVITYTATNTLTALQYVTVAGATSWQYNGTFQVATRSGSQFTVNWTLASAGSTSTATAFTPLLEVGEVGYETDTEFIKIGDGKRTWELLPYFNQHKTTGVRRFETGTYHYAMNAGTSTSSSHTQNLGFFTPIEIPSTTKLSSLVCWRTATGAGTSIVTGIYNHNYSTGLPTTLRHNAGTTTFTASVAATITTALAENGLSYITLLPGIYWICLAVTSASPVTFTLSAAKNFHSSSTILGNTGSNPGSLTATISGGVLPITSGVTNASGSASANDRLAVLVA